MKIFITLLICLLIASCKKETTKTTKKGVLPSVKTIDATNVFSSQANAGGIITSEGSSVVTEKGVCWSTVPGPTISSSKTINGGGAASFTSLMTNLSPNSTYYFRAYATNNVGTAYGLTYKLSTLQGFFLNSKGVTDIDGNSYATVKIGSTLNGYQEWMSEDLRTTKFNDGSPIKNELNDSLWQFSGMAAYRYYYNDAAYPSKLYNFYTVSNGNVCPSGWHVPNTSEWSVLFSKLGSNTTIHGKFMKTPGTTDWVQSGGTNSSGFGGKGTGIVKNNGVFEKHKVEGNWWTSNSLNTQSASSYSLYSSSDIVNLVVNSKQAGLSIRCIKDN